MTRTQKDYLIWIKAKALCQQCSRPNPAVTSDDGKKINRPTLKVIKINPALGEEPLNLLVVCRSCERWHIWNQNHLEEQRKATLAEDKRVGQTSIF